MHVGTEFADFFKEAMGSGFSPFPFQVRFATGAELPALVNIPTGLGKTAMVVLGWLWRRRCGGDLADPAPRRLVYCLPMRVLVEQTRNNAVLWLDNLNLLAGRAESDGSGGTRKLRSYTPDLNDPDSIAVHVLMGGEDDADWDMHPEREAILIGTQDMLLSRALNRGYAASRARWPVQFGLLHTDCLWVFDEIQLMGAGLATSAQLEAFRRKLPWPEAEAARNGHGSRSVWMSATMQRGWLKTVDFAPRVQGLMPLDLTDKDRACDPVVDRRWRAEKPLARAEAAMGESDAIASEVLEAHLSGTRTIVVVNTVKRACALFDALKNIGIGRQPGTRTNSKKTSASSQEAVTAGIGAPGIVLLHSRFRPEDRKQRIDEALDRIKPGEPGTIIVSTQVIEAGIDVSAATLFTELAPWAALVQRCGRCNRLGEESCAQVRWIDLPGKQADAEKLAPPYELADLKATAERLEGMTDVGVRSLPKVELAFEHTHVIRRRDLIDLFDTTPDLAGNDLDIDRFVREAAGSDVRVFWREWDQPHGHEPPPVEEPAPRREELCGAPIGSKQRPGFQHFAQDHPGQVWKWDFLERGWTRTGSDRIGPGQLFLIHADAGGYSAERGWAPSSGDRVAPLASEEDEDQDATDGDRLSHIGVWKSIAQHTDDVYRELDEKILRFLEIPEARSLRMAARWHDRGKAHEVFQNAIDDGQMVQQRQKPLWRRERPNAWNGCRCVAKAPGRRCDPAGKGFWRRYDWLPETGRKHFRHELASALAVLLARDGLIPSAQRDLVAYLVAAHHGKVRCSIRSLPNESRPDGDRRFARGVWGGDDLRAADLGGGVTAPAVTLSLEPMELGLCAEPPLAGQPSWAERMIRLRDALGPFRLAYLEALLRAADCRASRAVERTS